MRPDLPLYARVLSVAGVTCARTPGPFRSGAAYGYWSVRLCVSACVHQPRGNAGSARLGHTAGACLTL